MKDKFSKLYMANGYCVKDKENMNIRGGPLTQNAQVLEIRVNKCSNLSQQNCKSDQEIEDYFKAHTFAVLSQYTVVDYDDHG